MVERSCANTHRRTAAGSGLSDGGNGWLFGNAINPGPLRIAVKLGALEVHALVDTGSDLDAIDRDLAVLQSRMGNTAFLDRRDIEPEQVGGFGVGMARTTETESDWTVTVVGSETWGGDRSSVSETISFREFTGLGDPIIFGLPTLDSDLGFELLAESVWIFARWVDRLLAPQRHSKTVASLQVTTTRPAQEGPVPGYHLDEQGWYPVQVEFNGAELAETLGQAGPWWCEAANDRFLVLNAPVAPVNTADRVIMTIMAMAAPGERPLVRPDTQVCRLRLAGPEELEAAGEYRALLTRSALEARIIGTAQYKARLRTNEQAKHWDELVTEIERRRELAKEPEKDQLSEEYKDELCQLLREHELCPPEFQAIVCERVIRPNADVLWHEGCRAPLIEGFKARIRLKPGATVRLRQPYSLSKYDEARVSYHIEEQLAEGKIRRWESWEKPPPMVTPAFLVERKGSLLGRLVGDYTTFNKETEDFFWPAPDADAVMMRATGKKFHTTMDCVWGYSGVEADEDTARNQAIIVHCGIFIPTRLQFGPKQGPAIYQQIQEETVGAEYKPNGEKLCDVFFDDTHASDHTLEEHIETLNQIFSAARKARIQYRFVKCSFFKPEQLLLGFICGHKGRRVDPAKVEQMRVWPEYTSCADIVSHVAFCQYLREFYGPDFPGMVKPLRAYAKSGADFKLFASDEAAQKARAWLITTLVEKVVLHTPDWTAAARPWESGRPFEMYVDASDESWCVVLCQRAVPGGTPRPIGLIARSFDSAATRWYTFEREFYAFKEGYAAIHKWVDGFVVFAFFDHENVKRAESVLKSRRASKKLTAWIADSQPMLACVVRVWIAGHLNVLSDAGSRAPWTSRVVKHLPVPDKPIKELIRLLFTHPNEVEEMVEQRRTAMRSGAWEPSSSSYGDVVRLPLDGPDGVPFEQGYRGAGAAGAVPRPRNGGGPASSTSSSRPGDGSLPDRSDTATPVHSDAAMTEGEPHPRDGPEEYAIGTDTSMSWRYTTTEAFESDRSMPGTDAMDGTSHATTETWFEDVPGGAERQDIIAALRQRDPLREAVRHEVQQAEHQAIVTAIKRRTPQTIDLPEYGDNYGVHFSEVCAGTAILTACVRDGGLTALEPVDKSTHWDLTRRADVNRLKRLYTTKRPLLTHFSPECRIFSIAYRPQVDQTETERYQLSLRLAVNCGELALFLVSLGLFVFIEDPLGAWIYELPVFEKLRSLPGFFFIVAEGCRFGLRHRVTGKAVKKGWKFLTNAPWMRGVGLRCLNFSSPRAQHHEHTVLEGSETGYSAAYPWDFCVAYRVCLQEASRVLRWQGQGQVIRRVSDNFKVIMTTQLGNTWPNWPLVILSGELEEERRIAAVFDLDPAGGAEFDERFVVMCKYLAEQTAVAKKVTHNVNRDGSEYFTVHYDSLVIDLRDGRDKLTMRFTAFGEGHRERLGTARAAVLAHTAYASSFGAKEPGRFGCGKMKPTGYHGDAKNEFEVRDVTHVSGLIGWQPDLVTFVPREAFCWNSVTIEEHPGYVRAKCLGHPIGEPELMHPRKITYADNSVGQVRAYREETFMILKKALKDVALATATPHGFTVTFGSLDGRFRATDGPEKMLLDTALKYYWSHSKVPISAVTLWHEVTQLEFKEHGEWRSMVAWHSASGTTVGFRSDPTQPWGDGTRELTEVDANAKFHFHALACVACFARAPEETYRDHREGLEIMGFPIPSSLRVVGLAHCLTALGIERGKLLEMYKTGPDTCAPMLLLLHGAGQLGGASLPDWVRPENREVINELGAMAELSRAHRYFTDEELVYYQTKVELKLLEGTVLCRPRRHVVPERSERVQWSDVTFRLTLCWGEEQQLLLEQLEMGGAALPATPSDVIEIESEAIPVRSITLFFGPGPEPPTADKTPIEYVTVEGRDIHIGEGHLRSLAQRSGLSLEDLRQAHGTLKAYRLHGGVLQRHEYHLPSGMHEWYTVIPQGAWRTVEFQGVKRRLSLRRYVVLIYHCPPTGAHRDRDRTIAAILDSGFWWDGLWNTVNSLIRFCWVCKVNKAKPYVTGLQRSRDFDGPFRYLVIDFVGPQRPASRAGNEYMFTCACGFSGWYWSIPTPNDTSETAARVLAERVMFDVAGVPVMLGSDRARAFVHSVIADLASVFGILQVLGTAYHPEAQSPVERPHREYKAMCRAYMREFQDWDRIAPIFQWTVRTTAKVFNANYTPYEVVLGLKPRLLLDAQLGVPSFVKKLPVEEYVKDLVTYLKKVHQHVAEQHRRVREHEHERHLRQGGTEQRLQVGDFVLMQRARGAAREGGRAESRHHDTVYQIVDQCGGPGDVARAFTICDAATGKTDLGFSQPVSADRLIAVEVLPLTRPDGDSLTRLQAGERQGTIVGQCIDGSVHIQWDDAPAGKPTHERLDALNYRWLG